MTELTHEALEACTLADCPTGLFMFKGTVGFKSEYTTTLENPRRYQCDAYVVESGEYFHGGARSTQERAALIVTPLRISRLIHAVLSRPAPCMGMAQNCQWVEGQTERCSCEGVPAQPSVDVVEAVARAICETLQAQFERFAPEVLDHLDMTPEYWRDAATAAINALDAVRGET